MTMRLRKSSRVRRTGEYAELEEPADIRPAFVTPDVEFDKTLAPHCSFPSIPLTEFPGRSETFRMKRDAKVEKKKARRAEKLAVYRLRRRLEKKIIREQSNCILPRIPGQTLPPPSTVYTDETGPGAATDDGDGGTSPDPLLKSQRSDNDTQKRRGSFGGWPKSSTDEETDTASEDIDISETDSENEAVAAAQKDECHQAQERDLSPSHRAHVVHLPPRAPKRDTSTMKIITTSEAARAGIHNDNIGVGDEPEDCGLRFRNSEGSSSQHPTINQPGQADNGNSHASFARKISGSGNGYTTTANGNGTNPVPLRAVAIKPANNATIGRSPATERFNLDYPRVGDIHHFDRAFEEIIDADKCATNIFSEVVRNRMVARSSGSATDAAATGSFSRHIGLKAGHDGSAMLQGPSFGRCSPPPAVWKPNIWTRTISEQQHATRGPGYREGDNDEGGNGFLTELD